MALPSSLRNNFSPLELEFVTEEEFVEIKPSVRLAKTRLLSGVRTISNIRTQSQQLGSCMYMYLCELDLCMSRRSSVLLRRRMQRKCRYG